MKKGMSNKILVNILHKPIQKIAGLMFNPNRFLIFVPEGGKVGNLYLDIHQALCVTKRDNKKLILIRPFHNLNSEIFKCDFGDQAHNDANKYNFRIKLLKIILNLLSGLINLTHLANVLFNRLFFRRLTRFRIPLLYVFIRYGVDTKSLEKNLYPNVRGNKFPYGTDNFLSSDLNVSLSQSQLSIGNRIQEEMGIPLDAKFVCLHIREPSYFNAPRHHIDLAATRNANILNYLLAIKFIIDQGRYVVRIGDPKMTPLPPMEGVVDYAISDYYSELMDIYLVSRCELFIGSDSGINQLPMMFRKPLCRINIVDNVGGFGVFPDNIIIAKHQYSSKEKRFLSYRERLENIPTNLDNPITNSGYIQVENTPNEILQCVKETYQYVSRKNIDFNNTLQEKVRSVRRARIDYLLEKNDLDLSDKQFFRARSNNLGKVSISFLEKCWEYGPYLKQLSEQYNEQGFNQIKFE